MGNESTWFHPAFVLFGLGLGLSFWTWRRFTIRRGWQVFSLSLFVSLFWLASYDGRPAWPVDLFLFSDPLLALVHTIAGRVFVPMLAVSLVFVVLAAVMGRWFCAHLCPMGALLDLSDRFIARRQRSKENRGAYRRVRRVKFVFLIVILVAAVAGFELLGFGDPLVWFTRFAATLFYPFVMAIEELALWVLRPLGSWFGWVELAYLEVILPAFEGAMITLGLLLALLLLARLQPRFWCRHLCPLGALLGWFGKWAPYRRQVSESCNHCNLCVRNCPMGAIHDQGGVYDRSECIACRQCQDVCPENAVRFSFGASNTDQGREGVQLGRRGFVTGMVGGVTAGLGLRSEPAHPAGAFLPLPLRDQSLIRPPGALPEPEFLSRCVRCSECMRACLSNTLQPDWYRVGLEGLWAPHMNLRFAACEQTCNVCGWVCPTGAIRPLDSVEKQYAKVGTAVVYREQCLPWSQNRRCLICDEQCPYNAIVFRHDAEHQVGLPVVNADKCNGCGQCEDKCPVLGQSAIRVSPQGELRLSEGSYREEAESLGLVFEAEDTIKDDFGGIKNTEDKTDAPAKGLPAGFDLEEE